MSLSYFDSSSVDDGVNALSYIDSSSLITAIQTAYPGDTYLDSTAELGYVYVYYEHTGGRQQKRIVHDPTNHEGLVQWSSFARDGTWEKNRIKVLDKDGAYNILYRSDIGSSEDLTHNLGSMTLNNS